MFCDYLFRAWREFYRSIIEPMVLSEPMKGKLKRSRHGIIYIFIPEMKSPWWHAMSDLGMWSLLSMAILHIRISAIVTRANNKSD